MCNKSNQKNISTGEWRRRFDKILAETMHLEASKNEVERELDLKRQNLPRVRGYWSVQIGMDVRYFIRISDMHLTDVEQKKLLDIGVLYVGDILRLWSRIDNLDYWFPQRMKKELQDMCIVFAPLPEPMPNWRPKNVKELSQQFFPEGLPVEELLERYA